MKLYQVRDQVYSWPRSCRAAHFDNTGFDLPANWRDKFFYPSQSRGRLRCAIVTCRICGAAVLRDEREPIDPTQRHAEWHVSHGESP